MIDARTVEHVARLARMGLSDAEATALGLQLSTILEYVDQLAGLENESGAPRRAGPAHLTLRPDVVTPSLPRSAVLANAPDETSAGLFRAPAVLD